MLDKELALILIVTISTLLWALGGKYWKGFRRIVLPILISFVGLSLGLAVGKLVLYSLIHWGVTSLPYGEKTPYWVKSLVGCSYVAPSLIFGFTLWQVILPTAFIVTFILSNWKPTSKDFTWKACELSVGFLKGMTDGIVMIF